MRLSYWLSTCELYSDDAGEAAMYLAVGGEKSKPQSSSRKTVRYICRLCPDRGLRFLNVSNVGAITLCLPVQRLRRAAATSEPMGVDVINNLCMRIEMTARPI